RTAAGGLARCAGERSRMGAASAAGRPGGAASHPHRARRPPARVRCLARRARARAWRVGRVRESRMSLAAFQDAFADALLLDPKDADPLVARLASQPAFAVYRNTVVRGCIEALQ